MPLLNERQCVIASYLIMTISLLMILPLHLLPGLLSGLLVYALVTSLSPYVERFSNRKYGRVTVVALFSVVIISLLVLLMVSLSAYVVHDLRGGGWLRSMPIWMPCSKNFKVKWAGIFLDLYLKVSMR